MKETGRKLPGRSEVCKSGKANEEEFFHLEEDIRLAQRSIWQTTRESFSEVAENLGADNVTTNEILEEEPSRGELRQYIVLVVRHKKKNLSRMDMPDHAGIWKAKKNGDERLEVRIGRLCLVENFRGFTLPQQSGTD